MNFTPEELDTLYKAGGLGSILLYVTYSYISSLKNDKIELTEMLKEAIKMNQDQLKWFQSRTDGRN